MLNAVSVVVADIAAVDDADERPDSMIRFDQDAEGVIENGHGMMVDSWKMI